MYIEFWIKKTSTGICSLAPHDVARYFSIMLPGTFYNVARKYPTLARNFNYISPEVAYYLPILDNYFLRDLKVSKFL